MRLVVAFTWFWLGCVLIATAQPSSDAILPDTGTPAPALDQALSRPIPRPTPVWSARRQPGGLVCRMDGPAARGHVQFVAPGDRQTIVRLHLQRANWRLPAVGVLSLAFAFGDGLRLEITGSTARDEILADIDIADFRTLLRGLAATHTASVSFPLAALHEPNWAIDLRSFPPAARAMQECMDASGLGPELPIPAPTAALEHHPTYGDQPSDKDAPETKRPELSADQGRSEIIPAPSSPNPAVTTEANSSLERLPAAPDPKPGSEIDTASAQPPVATLVRPLDSTATPDQKAPKQYGVDDLAALRREYGDDPEKLMQGPAWNAPFSASGRYRDFTEAHLSQPLWIARVVVNDPATKEIACFFDHNDPRLVATAPGTFVHVTGSIITFLDDTLVLSNNCRIDRK